MKHFRLILLAVLAVAAASCSNKARIDGTLAGAPDSQVIVKLLDVNTYKVLDTLKTNGSGAFSYKMNVAEGEPQFVYLFYGDTKVASLILESGDAVKVSADTLGTYSVEGSEESELLRQVEQDFVSFALKMDSASDAKELTQTYVDYYRDRVKYVLEHPFSLTSINVLYQSLNEGFPIFSQTSDAMHFRRVADSLKTKYPASKYVTTLDKDAAVRMNRLSLNALFDNAPEAGYPDLSMPDTKGAKVAISDLDAKVVLVHFWAAGDAEHKIFNLDVLKPLYEDYHSKGLEIYQIGLDVDKAVWATTVKNQQLPWVNVNDGLGTASTSVVLYNVTSIPVSYLIADGELVDDVITDEKALRKVLDKLLK